MVKGLLAEDEVRKEANEPEEFNNYGSKDVDLLEKVIFLQGLKLQREYGRIWICKFEALMLALNNQIIIWVHFLEWIPMGVTLVTIPLLSGENTYLRLITRTPLTTCGLPYMINPSSGTWSLLRDTTYLLLYFCNIYLICLLIICISDACC